jgi:hypothetical protein
VRDGGTEDIEINRRPVSVAKEDKKSVSAAPHEIIFTLLSQAPAARLPESALLEARKI